MKKFIVTGGERLNGVFRPTGNKNESLPVLASCLLTTEKVVVENIPLIKDFLVMRELLESLGVKISFRDPKALIVEAEEMRDDDPDGDRCGKIRGSFLLAAPLLHRFGKARLPVPGGDVIGRRRIDTHLLALKALGAEIEFENGIYSLSAKKLKGAEILLDEASVMATENAVMAAAVAEGKTVIYNAACEPHVQGLCNMLVKMGARIEGIASNRLEIVGVPRLSGCTHRLMPDHTEIGSVIGLAAITDSEIEIEDCADLRMGLIPTFFAKLGIRFEQRENSILVPREQEKRIVSEADSFIPKIDDGPWPGFPADLTSIMTVVATQCRGSVLIFEKMFESRLFWVDKLIGMGASVILCDPHRAVVHGPSALRPGNLSSPDIRAGMALLLAALCAEGESRIFNVEQIDRGYEKIDARLNALGAKIQRV